MLEDNHNWQIPKIFPVLDNAEVHVWMASVKDFIAKQKYFCSILSAPEKKRANRFVFPEHKKRFIIMHGILRELLANYLHTKPENLSFTSNKFGKPKIDNINFNISHSRDLALFVFAKNYDVGVDIEFINKESMNLDIAERFFSTHEAQALLKLPVAKRPQAFFNCWTRKEAFIKAIGEGLAFPLNKFDVDINSNFSSHPDFPGHPRENGDPVGADPCICHLKSMDSRLRGNDDLNQGSLLLDIRDDKYKLADWSLMGLNPATNYAAALGVSGSTVNILKLCYLLTPH
jgi:4'-phosphopantetheinyl transferase